MSETVFYDWDGVRVTASRIVVNDQTYALGQITSVKVDCTPPKTRGAGVLIAVGITLGIIGFLVALNDVGTGIPALLFAGVVGLIGFVLKRRAKGTYAVVVRTASGEQKALVSQDQAVP